MIGRVISNRYVVEEVVGTGGMAVVYRAWDTKQKQMVAIKVLRPEFESDQEFVRRFSREAEAAAKMSHENIVNLIDVGQDGDLRYIVMEYVDGQTLKDMIRTNGRLRPETAVRMAIRILAAVDHAHKNNIVHRDIKPQNILLDRQGTVKVADFGIARLKTAQTTRLEDGNNSALGSVHYFSPEQASGEVADEKSDLYSVGVVIYEMLTGVVPFDGETAVSVALKHVSENPRSMREFDPSISQALDEVVMRALCKDTERRYQTAAEMAADLRKALSKPRGGFVKYPLTKEEIEKQREAERRRKQQRQKQLRMTIRIAGVFAGLALILVVLWYFMYVYNVAKVPSVLGLSQEDAEWLLTNSEFESTVVSVYDEDVEAGVVLGQNPAVGTPRKKGSHVEITVSAGSQWVYLDSLSGMKLEEAERSLDNIGVKQVTKEYIMSDAEVSTVVSQTPESGWITRETEVVLRVSGERTVVPPLLGLTLEGAEALIKAEGLAVGSVSEAYSADAAAGTVIAQSVAPSAPILIGEAIDLTISQAQPERDQLAEQFTLVVPLDNLRVRVELTAPSGNIIQSYNEVLAKGTYVITLNSNENGVHTVRVYMDDTLMEETSITFE